VIDGSSSDDTIVVTDAQVTGTLSQTITYHRPDPDKNVLSLNVNGNDGVDHITVQSTRDVVPVKVDGGLGDDVINVGGGTLSDVVGLSRPGVQVPYARRPGRRRRRRRARHPDRRRPSRLDGPERHPRLLASSSGRRRRTAPRSAASVISA